MFEKPTWVLKVVGIGALAFGVELLCRLICRHRPAKALTEVYFFPSEVACVEHIFNQTSADLCLCPLAHGVNTSFSHLLRHILSASTSLDLCLFSFTNMDLCRAVLTLHRQGVTIRVLTDRDYAAITGSQVGTLRKAVCGKVPDDMMDALPLLRDPPDELQPTLFSHTRLNTGLQYIFIYRGSEQPIPLFGGRTPTPCITPDLLDYDAGICVRCNVGSGYMHHKFAVVDSRLLITGSLNWTLTAVQDNTENVIVTEQPELLQPFMKEFHRLWEFSESAQARKWAML